MDKTEYYVRMFEALSESRMERGRWTWQVQFSLWGAAVIYVGFMLGREIPLPTQLGWILAVVWLAVAVTYLLWREVERQRTVSLSHHADNYWDAAENEANAHIKKMVQGPIFDKDKSNKNWQWWKRIFHRGPTMITVALSVLASLSSIPVLGLGAASARAAGSTSDPDSLLMDSPVCVIGPRTFNCSIDGWPSVIGDTIPVRIAGIDCPDFRGVDSLTRIRGLEAKEFTDSVLRAAGKIELTNIRRDTCFGLVADVKVDGKDLAALLLRSGHAMPSREDN